MIVAGVLAGENAGMLTAATTLALVFLQDPGPSVPKPELPPPFAWEQDLATAHKRARETGKPVIAYFTFET